MTTGLIIATPAHAGLLFANAGALIFNMYQMSSVGNSRKATGLKYPAEFWPHADEEKDHAKLVFNCKQRAHHSFMENTPIYLICVNGLGLLHPKIATALVCVYLAARVAFFQAYATGNPKKRAIPTILSSLSQVVAIGTLIFTGVQLLLLVL